MEEREKLNQRKKELQEINEILKSKEVKYEINQLELGSPETVTRDLVAKQEQNLKRLPLRGTIW